MCIGILNESARVQSSVTAKTCAKIYLSQPIAYFPFEVYISKSPIDKIIIGKMSGMRS